MRLISVVQGYEKTKQVSEVKGKLCIRSSLSTLDPTGGHLCGLQTAPLTPSVDQALWNNCISDKILQLVRNANTAAPWEGQNKTHWIIEGNWPHYDAYSLVSFFTFFLSFQLAVVQVELRCRSSFAVLRDKLHEWFSVTLKLVSLSTVTNSAGDWHEITWMKGAIENCRQKVDFSQWLRQQKFCEKCLL